MPALRAAAQARLVVKRSLWAPDPQVKAWKQLPLPAAVPAKFGQMQIFPPGWAQLFS